MIGSSVVDLHMLPLPLSATCEEKIKKNSRTVILRSWTAYCKRKLSKSSGKRTEQLLTTLFFWVVSHRRQEGKQTFQRVPSPPESVFAFLADFLLASTLSTGLAKQCCHKNHILFCIAALIGPDGSHAAGSSFFKRKDYWVETEVIKL